MSDSGDPPWWDTPYLEIIGEIGWESGGPGGKDRGRWKGEGSGVDM